tara:strand:+ start:3708 stop:4952 length:1245 start_codon:yes stop_codon:yes gene_type:complete
MDLYGLNAARAEGNARTTNNDLFNEQILSTRDRINNTLDAEKITAQGNLRGQQSTDTTDKIIYDVHDAMSGLNLVSSYNRFGESYDAYQKAKAARGGVGGFGTFISSQNAVRRGDVDKVFGSATNVGTKASSDIVTTKTPSTIAETRAGGRVTGRQPAAPLTEEQQSAFLDESARAGGVDARPTPTLDEQDRAETARVQADADRPGRPDAPDEANRPKTNEPSAANENTPEIPDKAPSATTELTQATTKGEELSGKVLTASEKLKKGVGFASTGLRAVGDIGGLVGTYEMFKNGFAKNKDGTVDRWDEVGQIASSVGTGLDIIGAFIPALEPVGQLAQAIGAVAETVDTHNKDEQATQDAQQDVDNVESTRKAQLDALPSAKANVAPVNNMVAGGLVGTQSQHINNATQGSGTF